MSVFIRFEAEEMDDIKEKVRDAKSRLIDVKSSTIEAKKTIREKREMINQAFLTVNEVHEELNRIISLMPKVDSAPMKNTNFFRIPTEHHKALTKLSDRISGLK